MSKEKLPSTPREAKEAGVSFYFTGKPCRHGHICPRRASNNACMECNRKSKRDWKKRNPEKVAAVKKAWNRSNRDKTRSYCRRWRQVNAEKRKVHGIVRAAINRGDLVRPNQCPRCGSRDEPIHAHHEDYSRPLDVTWVCSPCHVEIHHMVHHDSAAAPAPDADEIEDHERDVTDWQAEGPDDEGDK